VKTSNLTSLLPAVFIVIVDQAVKLWVRSTMPIGRSYRIIGEDFFRLTHVENDGIAFGLNAGSPLFLAIFTLIASVIILYFILTSHRPGAMAHTKTVRFSLGLILGGALGNLIDRLFFGKVTDYLDFDFPDFIMTRWPVFNLADSAVTIGVFIWCIYLLINGFKKTPAGDDAPEKLT